MNKFLMFLSLMVLSQRGSAGVEPTPEGGGAPASELDNGGQNGGSPDPTSSEPDSSNSNSNSPDPVPVSIYGDRTVAWPEGMEDVLKNEPSLKPFVGDDGALNVANLLKSYHHTKKMQGVDKTSLPTENSTEEELQEFHNKLGASSEIDAYKIEAIENSNLEADFTGALQKFAHENKLPVGVAKQLNTFMETQAASGVEAAKAANAKSITDGLDTVKKEMGSAYDSKLSLAKRVINDLVADEELTKAFKDPALGSHPAVLKTLMKIGEKLYKEDGFKGADNRPDVYSPEEAAGKITDILGDANHAYNKPEHPSHAKAQKDMLKLFEMKNSQYK